MRIVYIWSLCQFCDMSEETLVLSLSSYTQSMFEKIPNILEIFWAIEAYNDYRAKSKG